MIPKMQKNMRTNTTTFAKRGSDFSMVSINNRSEGNILIVLSGRKILTIRSVDRLEPPPGKRAMIEITTMKKSIKFHESRRYAPECFTSRGPMTPKVIIFIMASSVKRAVNGISLFSTASFLDPCDENIPHPLPSLRSGWLKHNSNVFTPMAPKTSQSNPFVSTTREQNLRMGLFILNNPNDFSTYTFCTDPSVKLPSDSSVSESSPNAILAAITVDERFFPLRVCSPKRCNIVTLCSLCCCMSSFDVSPSFHSSRDEPIRK
jgi:hypothetical protein